MKSPLPVIPGHFRFGWQDYHGERIGLFSYNNAGEAGYADFDAFTYRYDSALTR